jgi:6-phosphogluconate dehydrogenase
VTVRDDAGAQWGNNNYVSYPNDVKAFLYNVTLPEPAIIADPGVSPADGTTVEGVQAFTFGFKSATGSLEELELDIYLGENTGENRDYAGHLGINLPAGSEAVASWVEQVVAGYGELDSKFHGLLAAAGYVVDAGDEANKQALKENIFYTAGDDGTGTWTIKLDTAVLGEEKVEFLVTVRDDAGAQWGNNNYVSYPNDVKAFLYNVTLPEPAIIADPGVSPADGTTVEGVQAFTFGFKSATGSLEELELDIYLGENTGANRDYAGHLGINLPAGSEAVASWVEQVVEGYGELDSKFHGLLAAAGYVVDAGDEANKQALKENIFYTAGDDGTGTWTIKLDTAVLGEEKVEFLVTVRDDAGAQWGNNNYVSYPNDVKAFLYNVTLPEPAIIADPGVSPADGTTVEGVQAFTFGFKSATGSLEELELDIYLGENTGENRDYAGHLGINLPAGSEAVASWVEQVVAGYGELDSKFHGLLAAAGYVVDAGDEANKQALKENIFYTAGDDGTGTWTIKLDTAVLGEEKVEFLVTVRDDAGAQWGNNNYVSYPNDVKAFLYNVTLPEPAIIADPGVSPADGTTVEGVQAFTFGFKSATGSLEELELDIYLGENTGENRDYAGHLGINLPAGSEAVASWVEQVVAGYGELDSKFHGLLAAAGYVVDAGDEANKQALKENIFYTAGDDGTGTWTIKLDTAVLGEEKVEFLVTVRDDAGAQWGNNNYVSYPNDVKAFLYNVTLPEPAIIADPGVSPADGTTVEGVQAFTFGFKSATGSLEELELDIYLGENTGENRDYAGHLGINLPAGSEAVASWVEQVVAGYGELDSKFHGLLAAAGYVVDAGDEANKQALKENIFYTAGDDGTGTWTIKLDTAVLGEEKVEFLVTVRDDAGAQWGNNNYVSYPNDVKAFLYNVTLPEPAIIADPGVSPADGTTVEGVQAFTFGFKSATGSLEELELDIYLGENTGENRDYAGHLGINLPAGSEAVASWVEQVVAGYGELDSKFHGLLAAAGYVVDAGDEANKQALKENIFYTAGDDGTGTWTIKLDTAVLGEEKVEFLVTVRDDAGAQWGNNNYVSLSE